MRGESELHDQQYELSGGLNCMAKNMLGEERSLWGKALVFSVLPIARYLRLSALVTFCTCLSAYYMPVCLLQMVWCVG